MWENQNGNLIVESICIETMYGEPKGPPCDKHFQKKNQEFNTHAKFTVIEKLEHVPTDKKKIRTLLERKEDQWMLRLKTIIPQGLNIGLNYPQDTTGSIW